MLTVKPKLCVIEKLGSQIIYLTLIKYYVPSHHTLGDVLDPAQASGM